MQYLAIYFLEKFYAQDSFSFTENVVNLKLIFETVFRFVRLFKRKILTRVLTDILLFGRNSRATYLLTTISIYNDQSDLITLVPVVCLNL